MRKRLIIAACLGLMAATGASPASADWACCARAPDGADGRSWNVPTRLEAERNALEYCSKRGRGCRIVGCVPNRIHTQAQAHEEWPERLGSTTTCETSGHRGGC